MADRKRLSSRRTKQGNAIKRHESKKRLFVDDLDNRTMPVRRFREIYTNVVQDLGGAQQLSEHQRQLARRIANLAIYAELMEGDLYARLSGEEAEFAKATGMKWDVERYESVSKTLNTLIKHLGLERKALNITPGQSTKNMDLDDYARTR